MHATVHTSVCYIHKQRNTQSVLSNFYAKPEMQTPLRMHGIRNKTVDRIRSTQVQVRFNHHQACRHSINTYAEDNLW